MTSLEKLIKLGLTDPSDLYRRTAQEAQTEHFAILNKVSACERGVAKLWYSVADGCYDARSLVGDETLSLKEILFGDKWPERPKESFPPADSVDKP